MRTSLVIASLGLAALVACVPNIPAQTDDDAYGRALYARKCSGCHALYPAERYSDAKWRSIIQDKIDLKKTRLSPDDRDRLERYLTRKKEQD